MSHPKFHGLQDENTRNESCSRAGTKSLPAEFPEYLPQPRFKIGDRISWQLMPSADFGVITGLQYAPAPHLQAWTWRYVVFLDPQSPSAAWVDTDTAWESDLILQAPTSWPTLTDRPQEYFG